MPSTGAYLNDIIYRLFVNDHMIMFLRVKSAMVIKIDDKGDAGAGAQASASIRQSLSSMLHSSCRNWGQRRFQQQGILIGAPGRAGAVVLVKPQPLVANSTVCRGAGAESRFTSMLEACARRTRSDT